MWCKIIEYYVNRIEFVKTQKTKYFIQTSEHIFQICIDCIVHNDIFLKNIFSLWSNILCEVFYLLRCFAFAELKCLCVPHWYVYFQILYETIDFYKWKRNLIWSYKWIICKKITEHTCWSVGVLLKFCTCNDSTFK